MPRAVIGLAAAFGVLVTSAAAAAATGSPPTGSTASIESVAQQLAAALPAGPASCDADSAAPPAMMAQFGGGAAPLSNHAPLVVQCALPYATGQPGGDCTGRHRIEYASNRLGATFTAELMGLDADGNVMQSFVVQRGDTAQLASRTLPRDWRFTQNKNQYGVFAPIPLLKVTARHEGETAVAYCSNIPWVEVVEPSGGVVTDDGSDDGEGTTQTKVFAAVPRTNPLDLQLYLDGVDLLAPGVITPALPVPLTVCTVESPCSGTAVVNGHNVLVTDLVVDIASDINHLSSNTVRATLNDLQCGGHVVRVETTKAIGALRNPMTEQCLIDDLKDTGNASVFAVTISTPTPSMITQTVPTPVKGQVCGGTDLISVNISGKALDVSSQQKVPGDGVNSGDKVTYDIDTTLDQMDLRKVFDGQESSLGQFASGSNRLVAAAVEIQGNRAYRRRIFAVGSNIKPLGVDPSATIIAPQALHAALSTHLNTALESKMLETMSGPTSTTIKNAFIVGLSADGVNTIMHKLCESPIEGDGRTLGQIFKDTVEGELAKYTSSSPLTTFPFEPPCSCDTTVKVWIDMANTFANSDFACPVTFQEDQLTVSLKLPNVRVTVKAFGHDDCFANHTTVDATMSLTLADIQFNYTITEADILNTTTTVGATPFTIGGEIDFSGSGGADYGVLGDVCNFFVEGFVTVLTFGQVDIRPFLYPEINIREKINLEDTVAPAKPGAIPMKAIYIEEQIVEPYHQKMSGEISLVSDIQITPDGITAGLRGTFATTKVDLDVEGTPGFEAKEPPLLNMGQMAAQGARDALVGLSDDAINMMFMSLAGGGDLKAQNSDDQGCFATGATLGTLLPSDCNTIDVGGDNVATAIARGHCHAIKGAECSTLSYVGTDPFGALRSTMRGVCHGAKGDVCASVFNFDLTNLFWCGATPDLNLRANQNVMFCAKADIPTMSFPNVAGAANSVPTELRMEKVSMALVIDRGGPGNAPNGAVDALLKELPGCFTGTQTASDCSVLAACTDINLNFAMENMICDGGKPGFRARFDTLKLENFEVGIVCSGQTTPSNDKNIVDTASDGSVKEPIALNAEAFSPPICGAGLDAGGFVSCAGPQIVALEADGDTRFRDFLAITCDLQ